MEECYGTGPIIPFHFICESKFKTGYTKGKQGLNLDLITYWEQHKLPMIHKYELSHPSVETSYNQFLNYRPRVTDIKRPVLLRARDALLSLYMPIMRGTKVISKDIAMVFMKLKSTPGIPFCGMVHNKEELIMSEDWETLYDSYWNDISYSENVENIVFQVRGKKELRKKEKEPRIYMCSPSNHQLAGIQLMYDQNIILKESDNPLRLEFNPWYGGWDSFMKGIDRWPSKFSADFKQFDSSQCSELLYMCYTMRYGWFNYFDKTRYGNHLRNWYLQMIYGYVCMEDGKVYQKVSGMPSGCFNTLSDNSLIHFLLILYAYYKKWPYKNFVDFKNEIYPNFTGDDSLCGTVLVRDDIQDLYNIITNDFGIVVKQIVYSNDIKDHTWHSCSTVELLGRFIPLPEVTKVYDSLIFGKRSTSRVEEYLKLLSLKKYSWASPEAYNVLSLACDFYERAYHGEIKTGTKLISYDDIKQQELTYLEVMELFFGTEVKSIDPINESFMTESKKKKQVKKEVKNILKNVRSLPQRRRVQRRKGNVNKASSALDVSLRKRYTSRGIPASVSNSYNPRTKMMRMGPAAKADTGEPGERFGFNLEWLTISSDASHSYMLNGNAGYVFDPFAIGGRTLVEASLFTKYCIRSLRLTYINIVGSSTAGNIVFAIAEDPMSQALSLPNPVTPKSISEFRHVREIPVNLPSKNMINYNYNGKFLFYVDPANSEDDRFTAQMMILAVGNGVSASSTYGKLMVEGVIDFYGPNNVTSPPSIEFKEEWIKMRSGEQKFCSVHDLTKKFDRRVRIRELEEKIRNLTFPLGSDPPTAPQNVNVVGGTITLTTSASSPLYVTTGTSSVLVNTGTTGLLVTAGTTALLSTLGSNPVSISGIVPVSINSSGGPNNVNATLFAGTQAVLADSNGHLFSNCYGLNGTTPVGITANSSGIISSKIFGINGTNVNSLLCDSTGVLSSAVYGLQGSTLQNITCDTAGIMNVGVFGNNGSGKGLLKLTNGNDIELVGYDGSNFHLITTDGSGNLRSNITNSSIGTTLTVNCGTSGNLPVYGTANGTQALLNSQSFFSNGTQSNAVTGFIANIAGGGTRALVQSEPSSKFYTFSTSSGYTNTGSFSNTIVETFQAIVGGSTVPMVVAGAAPGTVSIPILSIDHPDRFESLDRDNKLIEPSVDKKRGEEREKKLLQMKKLQEELDLDSPFVVVKKS